MEQAIVFIEETEHEMSKLNSSQNPKGSTIVNKYSDYFSDGLIQKFVILIFPIEEHVLYLI